MILIWRCLDAACANKSLTARYICQRTRTIQQKFWRLSNTTLSTIVHPNASVIPQYNHRHAILLFHLRWNLRSPMITVWRCSAWCEYCNRTLQRIIKQENCSAQRTATYPQKLQYRPMENKNLYPSTKTWYTRLESGNDELLSSCSPTPVIRISTARNVSRLVETNIFIRSRFWHSVMI